jgi:ABC-type phosphate transport system substrate-binding protein
MKILSSISLLLVLFLFVSSEAYATDLAIVVNPENPVEELSLKDLGRIFRLEKQYWEGSSRIYLVLRESGSAEKGIALRKIYGMSDEGLKKVWLDKVYREEIPSFPKVLNSNETVIRFVSQLPNAIGFIDASRLDRRVKVLRIDRRLPGEQGYPLSDD